MTCTASIKIEQCMHNVKIMSRLAAVRLTPKDADWMIRNWMEGWNGLSGTQACTYFLQAYA